MCESNQSHNLLDFLADRVDAIFKLAQIKMILYRVQCVLSVLKVALNRIANSGYTSTVHFRHFTITASACQLTLRCPGFTL